MAQIDNSVYDTLGERWYEAWDDPVALLRAEGRIKNEWIENKILSHFSDDQKVTLLDIGCGAGFLTNEFAQKGYEVTGVDNSPDSLRVARNYDKTKTANYIEADALHLPFPDNSFDVVTCMDFLEHVKAPRSYIAEAGRVLKPGGLFFFHTFDRNVVSWFLVIKCVEWFVKNTPKNMHVIELFIKPADLKKYCREAGMKVEEMTGIRPVFSSIPLKSLFTGVVPPEMKFVLTKSLLISYMGYARKTM
jgi:2-polyprenyl-6-hydroxyphenyl methylase / 3-demethylubiquinone-9 3-methyltransferase